MPTIHQFIPANRPREKMIKYGPEKLTNAELLALILRTGKKGENVLQMATNILKKFEKQGLDKVGVDDLTYYSGLGTAKACEIIAVFELGRRFLQNKKSVLLISPQAVYDALSDIRISHKEHFVVFYLDIRNQIIKREIISIGTLNASLVHPREVFEPAIIHKSAQIIIAHNHPSGDCTPSEEDLKITKQLKQVGEIMGIELLDHVIVSREGFVSLEEKGYLH